MEEKKFADLTSDSSNLVSFQWSEASQSHRCWLEENFALAPVQESADTILISTMEDFHAISLPT